MTRRLGLALTAMLLLGVVPAAADDVLIECANAQDLEVITRAGLGSDIGTPSFLIGDETVYKNFLVDLSPVPEGSTRADAVINTTMTWDVPANDYDLLMSTSFGSVQTEDYQPIDPPVEYASLRAKHCEVIEIGALDYLAPAAVDSIALNFTTSGVVVQTPPPA